MELKFIILYVAHIKLANNESEYCARLENLFECGKNCVVSRDLFAIQIFRTKKLRLSHSTYESCHSTNHKHDGWFDEKQETRTKKAKVMDELKDKNLHTNIYFILIVSLSSRLSDYEQELEWWKWRRRERAHLVDDSFMNKLNSNLRWQFNNLICHMMI